MAQQIKVVRLVITGGRDYGDKQAVYEALDAVKKKHPELKVLIHGDARGADTLGKEWALERGITPEPYPANWNKYKNGAGPMRNQEMIDRGKPDAAVAFPGNSGTSDMIKRLTLAKIEVWIPYKFDITKR
jgi:predicted Rossmann-fold nucleotide-binding protein